MDTGITIRTVQPVSIQSVRPAPPVERQTVATDLPETRVVNAASENAAPRLSQDNENSSLRAALNSVFDRKAISVVRETTSKIVQDEATKELIFQKVSSETGQIVGQYPDEALLRMKAYNAQLRSAELDKAADQGANLA